MPLLNIVGLILVGLLAAVGYIAFRFITRNGGEATTEEQEWIDKLGLKALYEAYLEALKASAEPDMQRDIVISYLVMFADTRFGMVLPLDIAYFLYEFIAKLVDTRGEDAVAALIASNASAGALLREGA